MASEDAQRLRWGLGYVAAGLHGDVWYAAYVPATLERFRLVDGERLLGLTGFDEEQELGSFRFGGGEDEVGLLADVFRRCLGIAGVARGILQSVYDPLEDRTTLRVVDNNGSVVGSAVVPLRLAVVTAGNDNEVLVRYDLESPIVASYELVGRD